MLNVLRALRMIGATLSFIGIQALAQSLPSNQYDDYDQEKYAQLLNKAEDNLNRAWSELQQGQSRLNQALGHEQDLQRQYRDAKNEYDHLRRQQIEINDDIQRIRQQQDQIRRNIDVAMSESSNLQNQLVNARANQSRARQVTDSLRMDLDRAAVEVNNARSNLNSSQQSLSRAEQALNQQIAFLDQLRQQIEAAPPEQRPALEDQYNAENQKLPALLAQRTNAANEVQNAQNLVSNREANYNNIKSRYDSALNETNNADRQVGHLQAALQNKQNEISRAQSDLTQAQNRESELIANADRVNRRIDIVAQQLRSLDDQIRYAQSEINQRIYERDQLQAIYNQRSQERNVALNRYNQVVANIETGRQVMATIAGRDGRADGTREGQAIGQERGTRDGIANGQKDGTQNGTADGRERDYNVGMNQGLVRAEAEAANPRTINTPAQGRAYEQGKRLGYEFGYRTGTNQGSYTRGRAVGEAEGLAAAVRDAEPREPVGYNDREQTYLNAPLQTVTLGESSGIMRNFNGVQGDTSENGDGRFYNPRPGSLPHPRLGQFYQQYYDASYRESLDGTFRSTYAEVYKRTYAANYEQAYNLAFARDYPDSRDLAFNQAYLGFTQGNAAGSQQKGHDDGFRFAYDQNIEIEKRKAYEHGVARCDELYTKNAVIKVISISLLDFDRDGINRPGESQQSVFIVKNFGLKPKTDLAMEASLISGPGAILAPRSIVPNLPPQSTATVFGSQQLKVLDSAAEGSTIQAVLRLVDSKEVARQNFNKQVLLPTITKLTDFDGIVIPGLKTLVKVTLTNRSQSSQSLSVDMSVDNSKISLAEPHQTVEKLAAGETKTLNFTIIGNLEARFEETELSVSVRQKGLVFGQVAQTVTLIQRHRPTPASLGLILSQNLARGSGKSLYSRGKFDTWDLRVDGVIGATQLANYTGKVVHLMADAGATMDSSSTAAINSFVSSGGQLVIWGADLDQSGIFAQLQGLAQVQPSRASSINEIAQGQTIFEGASGNLHGQAGKLVPAGLKARPVFKSSFGTIATAAVADGITRSVKAGRIYTFAFSADGMTAESIVAMTQSIGAMAKSFVEKANFAALDVRWINLFLLDIQDELLTAETENPQLYLNKKKDNKIYAAVERILKNDVTKESKTAFARGYSFMMETLRKTGSVSTGAAFILDDMRIGGNTWKTLFCDLKENRMNPLCKKEPNGGG
jgi:hypothetical protein